MMAPPEELAVMMEDVRRAKREIREISRAKTKTRELAKKALKSGLVPVLASSELDFNRCGFGILFTSDSIFVKLHRWPFITLIPHFNCDVIFLFTLIDDFFNFEICTELYIFTICYTNIGSRMIASRIALGSQQTYFNITFT